MEMMHVTRRLTFAISMLASASPERAVLAQSPAEQSSLQRWDHQLASLEHAGDLRPLLKALPDAHSRIADLELAMLRLRLGAVDADRKLRELGLSNLSAIAAQHRDWPYPEYLLAREFFRYYIERQPMRESSGLSLGESYTEAGWRRLRYALEVDASFPVARALAITNLVAEGDRVFRSDEREVLEILLRLARPEGDALLVAGRDRRREGKLDSALALFTRAAELGSDPSRLFLERARTRIALGDTAHAVADYWNGLAALMPEGREMYRFDLAWLITDDSLKVFNAVPQADVSPWLRTFWAQRDAATAAHPGERLVEHLRRWAYVMSHYRMATPWRHNQFTRVEYLFEGLDLCVKSDAALYELLAHEQPFHPGDPRQREMLLDHRGLIYLRHGEPIRKVSGPGFEHSSPLPPQEDAQFPRNPLTRIDRELASEMDVSMWQNESWLYWFEGRYRLLHFRGSKAMGEYAPTTLSGYLPVVNALGNVYGDDWEVRGQLLEVYAKAVAAMRVSSGFSKATPCIPAVREAIATSRDDAHVGTNSDSDTPPMPTPWNAVIQAFAVPSPGERSKVLITFAVPGAALEHEPAIDGTSRYAIHFRIVLFERQSGETVSVDTVRTFQADSPLAGKAHLTGWFEVPVHAGNWQVAVRAWQQPDRVGALAQLASMSMPSANTLSIGDLIPGVSGTLTWPAPDGEPFPVNAMGTWTAGASAELFYVAQGMQPGVDYRTTIEVEPVGTSKLKGIKLSTTDRATTAVAFVRRTLGLSTLVPGAYQVTVTIEGGGRRVSRTLPVRIVAKSKTGSP